jgi:PBP1b-binding outer membrane lipoprotein LpoB
MKQISFAKFLACVSIVFACVFFAGCASTMPPILEPVEKKETKANPKLIGQVNMISTRNVDMSRKYEPLSSYSGGSQEELKETRANSIEMAVNNTVQKIPGGEFIMNAKIYMVNLLEVTKKATKEIVKKSNGKIVSQTIGPWSVVSQNEIGDFFAVEGDVYGIAGNLQYRGLKVGDAVNWKNANGGWVSGKIRALKDTKTCLVIDDTSGNIVEKNYDDLVKAQ